MSSKASLKTIYLLYSFCAVSKCSKVKGSKTSIITPGSGSKLSINSEYLEYLNSNILLSVSLNLRV